MCLNRKLLKRLNIHLLFPFLLTLLLVASRDFFLQWTVNDPGVPQTIEAGATFIQGNAETLHLDWKAAYREIINDLGIKHIRIPIFWDQIEPEPGKFQWKALDWQMAEAAKANAKVVLVVGHRVPRYPECYAPAWAQSFAESEFQQALLKMVETTVVHFREHPALELWQVENEPLAKILGKIWGGPACREIIPLVAQEVRLVRSLDPTHRTMVTFASVPWTASQLRQTLEFGSDVVGITVWNKLFFKSPLYNGYVETLKLGFLAPLRLVYQKVVAETQGKQLWVAELQAEPWGPFGPYHFDRPEDAYETTNPERLSELWQSVTEAGISRIYFWGAEWWLSERNKGNPIMFDTVKRLIRSS